MKCNNCEKFYIGQTKRNIKTRFKEHFSHIKYYGKI
ncbi:MAG: GIY-YIG nuclease family protein [Candidatus Sulcia muelleri]|nr:GIY-YIG nuclease family protein [Candidatus Karelsulcia muelleri]